MRKLIITSVIAWFAIIYAFSTVFSQTPSTQWINFYGSNSKLDALPIPVGTVVDAYDSEGILCGRFTVNNPGSYGFLACYLDDPNTETDEGVDPEERVAFKLNGLEAGSYQLPSSIQNGDRFLVELSAVSIKPPNRPDSEPVTVPEPVSIILFSTGLAGLAAMKLRSRHK